MALVDVYSQVVANLKLLSELTGEEWDLLWSEQDFGYEIICGSRVIRRAPWVTKVHELLTAEVIKHKPKIPKKKRRKPAVKPVVIVLFRSYWLCILS